MENSSLFPSFMPQQVLGDWRAAQRIEFSLNGGVNGRWANSRAGASSGSSGEDVQVAQLEAPSSGDSNSSGGGRGGLRGGAAGAGLAEAAAAAAAAAGGGLGEPMKFWVVNTHLDHYHQDNRQRQV